MRIIISAPTRNLLPRGAAFAAALAACAVAAPAARAQGAPAQGLLPPYGADVRVGDLRNQFARVFDTNPPAATERAWIFTPTLDISETYDSGVLTRHGSKADFITRVSPGFALQFASPRVTGTASYAPTVNLYAMNGSQTGITHNLNASATAILMPDLLFADLRGYASTQPILGGLVTPGTTGGTHDQMQTESFTFAPYLRKRFGDTATVNAGYSITRSMTNYLDAKGTTPLVAGLAGNVTTQQENASVTSGSDFGRIQASLAVMATQYDGSALYRGAHNQTITLSTGYALTRTVTVTSSVGHETIVYGKSGGLRPIDGFTWSGGVRYTPNPDSLVNASYGHQQGSTSFAFDGSFAVSPRLHLFGRYSQAVGTGLENLQNALAGTIAGPNGVSVDRNTLGPVQLTSLLGQQQGIYRTTTASLTATLNLDRDTITVSFDDTDRQLLSAGVGPGYGSNSGMTGTLGWQHLLNETLSSNLTVQYGTRSFPGGGGAGRTGDGTTAAVSLSVSQTLSPTLSTNYSFSHTETTGPNFGLSPTHDLATISLHKAF